MRNAINMVCGLLEIADGLSSIFSLGFYHAGLTFKFACWFETKLIERKRELENKS